jgi:hypothetical protein
VNNRRAESERQAEYGAEQLGAAGNDGHGKLPLGDEKIS